MKLVSLSSDDLELSYVMARACSYTYEKIDSSICRQIQEEIGLREVEQFQFQSSKWYGISGLSGYFKNYPVIAFKGSNSKDDWVKNIKLFHEYQLLSWKKQAPYGSITGKVHSGFNTAVNSNLCHLKSLVKNKYSQECREIILTGHSLGGAIAILTAAAFSKDDDFRCQKTVYTYASPRVGDKEFRNNFEYLKEIKHYRFEYGYDSVPHLPLARPFNFLARQIRLGRLVPEYQHTGELRYLMKDEQSNPIVVKEPPEILKFLKRMQVHIANINNLPEHLQKEHHIDTYTSHIKGLKPLDKHEIKMPNYWKIISIITFNFLSERERDKTPLLTYRETIEYFTEDCPKYPIVNYGVILRKHLPEENYTEIYQIFMDEKDELICYPHSGSPYGRVLLVEKLDEELEEKFGKTDMVVFK